MNKYNQIKQAVLDKLFLDDVEAEQEGYLNRMLFFANECLVRMANDIKENIKDYEVKVYDTLDEIKAEGAVLDITDNIYKKAGIKYYLVNTKIIMPSDFISHTGTVYYEGESTSQKIMYSGRNFLKIMDAGSYTFTYNAMYPEITETIAASETELDIDQQVLYCLPSYIASQLLAQSDPQRSAILRNEFELMAARLDNNVLTDVQSFRSEGGWY